MPSDHNSALLRHRALKCLSISEANEIEMRDILSPPIRRSKNDLVRIFGTELSDDVQLSKEEQQSIANAIFNGEFSGTFFPDHAKMKNVAKNLAKITDPIAQLDVANAIYNGRFNVGVMYNPEIMLAVATSLGEMHISDPIVQGVILDAICANRFNIGFSSNFAVLEGLIKSLGAMNFQTKEIQCKLFRIVTLGQLVHGNAKDSLRLRHCLAENLASIDIDISSVEVHEEFLGLFIEWGVSHFIKGILNAEDISLESLLRLLEKIRSMKLKNSSPFAQNQFCSALINGYFGTDSKVMNLLARIVFEMVYDSSTDRVNPSKNFVRMLATAFREGKLKPSDGNLDDEVSLCLNQAFSLGIKLDIHYKD